MAVPQEKTTSYAAKAASGQSSFLKILYCTVVFATLLMGIVSSGLVAAAQEERPQITPGERRGPRKKDAEPRAVALLKLSSDGKASLVPIAILINGKFWDAGSYKASPVPMALEPGTVYEAERSGSSLGLFTVNTALHSNAVNAPIPWLGTGAWVPTGTDTGKKTLQAEAAPVGIDNSDAPPRLTKNPTASTTAPASAPSANSAPASTPSSTTPSSPSTSTPSSGDEPPRLTKPATQQTPPENSQPTSPPSSSQTSTSSTAPPSDSKPSSTSDQSGSNQPGQDTSANKPADSKNDSKKPDTSKSDVKQADRSNTPVSDSGTDEAHRPRLRRGKPAQSFADEDIPGYSKLGAKPSSSSSATVAKAAPTGSVQLIPAISDSAGPDPHSYGFEWLKGEEEERRQQLITLAQEQVRAYMDAKAKATISAKTATSKTAPTPASHHVPVKKPAPPVLSNVQMTAYDLWSTNVPVVIFSAQAHMPPATQSASSATSSAPPDDLQYSVLIVAYPDIYNNLHKLYAGVTDKYHLDLTPRLELVDAVDADGDGRGELLFSKTSDAGSGWVIYRATADKLWKMYDSLNPE